MFAFDVPVLRQFTPLADAPPLSTAVENSNCGFESALFVSKLSVDLFFDFIVELLQLRHELALFCYKLLNSQALAINFHKS